MMSAKAEAEILLSAGVTEDTARKVIAEILIQDLSEQVEAMELVAAIKPMLDRIARDGISGVDGPVDVMNVGGTIVTVR